MQKGRTCQRWTSSYSYTISLPWEGKNPNATIYVDIFYVMQNHQAFLYFCAHSHCLDLEETVVFLQSTVSGLQATIDDLYFTENLQNQGLIDLNDNLEQVETEIANVDYDLNTLQSNLNDDYPQLLILFKCFFNE